MVQRKLTPRQVGRRFGVAAVTVIDWCDKGLMPAVNVASPKARRRRWRMSEDDVEAFEARRGNREAVVS